MKKKSIIIIVIIILLLSYPLWRIHDAKTRINDFAQQISVGSPIEAVELSSKKLDLKVIRSAGKDSESLTLIVWDGWAYARWICLVSIENDKVVSKKLSFVD